MNRDEIKIDVTEKLIYHYSKVTKDDNPIHLDKKTALSAGLPNRIAHGMIFMLFSTKLLSPYLLNGWFVQMQEMKWMHPIYINNTVIIRSTCDRQTDELLTMRLIGVNEEAVKVFHSKIILKRLNKH